MAAIENLDGSLLILGGTTSTDGDFANNNGDHRFLLKLDRNGNLLWTKTFGRTSYDVPFSFIKDGNGNYLVVGESDGQGWVFKLDGEGNIVWEKRYGGSQRERFNAISVTTEGDFILVGSAQSNDGDVTGYRGGVGFDAWVMKIDNNGNKLWQKTYGGTNTDGAFGIVPTKDKGFIIEGQSSSYDGDMVGNHGETDVFVIKLDRDGNRVWNKMIGGTGKEMRSSITSSNDGAYLLALGTHSATGDVNTTLGVDDVWILKIDEDGNDLGKHAVGGSGNDELWAIIKNTNGSYAIVGSTNSSDGDVVGYQGYIAHDLWILKFQDK
jgi:hypothetical protein